MRGLIELMPVQDIYVSGLGAIEHVGGGNLRFVLYVNQVNDDGVIEKIVVAKFIGPVSSLPEAITQSIASMGGELIHRLVPERGEVMN